ncbi:MAG: hypothetical protein OEM38_12695 [Gammaproteobacteria bacterium]|nr:hypothetical protein [Gammaproteobacteria bacterium]
MNMSNADTKKEKRNYWAKHIKQWQSSGKTQSQYCQIHQLKLHQFVYWKQVFVTQPEKIAKQSGPSGFISVQISEPSTQSLILQLPGGLRIDGIQAGNLELIREIIRWHV